MPLKFWKKFNRSKPTKAENENNQKNATGKEQTQQKPSITANTQKQKQTLQKQPQKTDSKIPENVVQSSSKITANKQDLPANLISKRAKLNGKKQFSADASENLSSANIAADPFSSTTSQKSTRTVRIFRRLGKFFFRRSKKKLKPHSQLDQPNDEALYGLDSTCYYDAREFRSSEMSREYFVAFSYPTVIITKPSTESIPPTPSMQKIIDRRKKRKEKQKQTKSQTGLITPKK